MTSEVQGAAKAHPRKKSRSKLRPLGGPLTRGQVAILASFVFCPLGIKALGRTGAFIARTNSRLFYSLFKYPVRQVGYQANLPWQANVTLSCRKLQRIGYLEEVGKVQWANHQGQEGWSPQFNLTESGLMYVLSRCNEVYLSDHRVAFETYQDRKRHVPLDYDEAFQSYLNDIHNVKREDEDHEKDFRTVADQSYQSRAGTDWPETLY